MKIPAQKQLPLKSTTITRFGGYNNTGSVDADEFYDMLNLTSDSYPLMSVRPQRAFWSSSSETIENGTINGIKILINNDITAAANINGRICYCTRTGVYADGALLSGVELNYQTQVRSMIPFGNGFFIVPDGIYVVYKGTVASVKRAEFTNTVSSGAVISICGEDGIDVSCTYVGDSSPQNPSQGSIWADTSSQNAYKQVYTDGKWVNSGRLYLKISGSGIEKNAFEGLYVQLFGVYAQNSETLYPVIKAEEGSVTVDAPLIAAKTVSGACGIKKTMPVLDFAAEHGNRIWGCRFGTDKNGVQVNEIYASMLGNPLEWQVFKGISTDSYVSSLGCPGAFTGVCALSSELVFFKENYIIKVSGFTPSDFYITPFFARGIESGAHLSAVNLNEKIFYKNAAGIMVYDGALPYCISASWGNKCYTAVAAGGVGSKYYIAVTDEEDAESIFVYDTRLNMWHREDNSQHARLFVYMNNCLYMLCRIYHTVVGYIEYNSWLFLINDKRLAGKADCIFPGTPDPGTEYKYVDEGSSLWYAESGRLGDNDKTCAVRSLVFKLRLEQNADFKVFICCNDSDEWQQLYVNCPASKGAFTVPVNTPRCSTFRLRLSGKGGCTVYSVSIVTEKLSEVNALGR